MSSDDNRAVAWSVMLLAMSLLAFELVLTRLFSVLVWNHFAFLAISIGLFGFGVSGVVAYLRFASLSPQAARRTIRRCALALMPSMWVVTAVACSLPITVEAGAAVFVFLAIIFVLASVPFFFGGLGIAIALSHFPAAVHRIYAFDLIGSGLGCVLVIGVLHVLDGPTAALSLAVLPALAALLLRRSWRQWGPLLLAILIVPANAMLGIVEIRFARLRAIDPEFERWNGYSQVTVFELEPGSWRGWAIAPTSTAPAVEMKGIAIDGDAFTPLIRWPGGDETVPALLDDISAAAYADDHPPEDVLIVGAGGGKDVLTALSAGAEHVTAIELNPIIVDEVMRGRYRDYSGDLYSDPRVDVHIGDGRAVARRDSRLYDIVQLSMVDTSASAAAGSYALTENSLYTVGAAREFLARVDEGGVFTCTWGNLPNVEGVNRLVSLYAAALRDMGIEKVHDKFAVINSGHLSSVLVKPSGFSDQDVARMVASMRKKGFRPLYLPGVVVHDYPGDDSPTVIRALLINPDLDEFYASHRLDLRPVDDDRPFFFYQDRIRDVGSELARWTSSSPYGSGLFILAKMLLASAVAVLAFMLGPLVLARRRSLSQLRGETPALFYFLGLGAGFITLEIATTQLFGYYLSHPLLGLGVSLTSLLVLTGVGSALSGRWPLATLRRRLGLALAGVVVLAGGGSFAIPALMDATNLMATWARALVCLLTLAPIAVLLGTAFPSGLRLLRERTTLTPWMWAVNAGASVFGSSLATLLVMHAGFATTLRVAAAIYVATLGVLWIWGRSSTHTGPHR